MDTFLVVRCNYALNYLRQTAKLGLETLVVLVKGYKRRIIGFENSQDLKGLLLNIGLLLKRVFKFLRTTRAMLVLYN